MIGIPPHNAPKKAHVSVITDEQTMQRLGPLSDEIAFFLSRKATIEQRRQDLNNRTLLGGVNYWFQIDDRSLSTILCYDKHPTDWDIDKILSDINDLEHIFYADTTNIIHWKG